jgi:hypothetical protein
VINSGSVGMPTRICPAAPIMGREEAIAMFEKLGAL